MSAITISLKIINKNKALAKIDVQINEINSKTSDTNFIKAEYLSHIK